MITTTTETIVKGTAVATTATGGATSIVSGVWLKHHQELIAAAGVFFGMLLGLIGLVVSISINIYFQRKQLELARQGNRRADDPPPTPLEDDRPDWLPDEPGQ